MKRTLNETIEKWASKVATEGDTAGWASVRDAVATDRPWTTFGPHHISLDQARDLLAYRDRVAHRLTAPQRRELRRAVWYSDNDSIVALLGGFSWVPFRKLEKLGLAEERGQVQYATDFGREVARVLGMA